MPRHLHYDGERFAYWTTLVEPECYVTYALTEWEAEAEARREWGNSFIRSDWPAHLARAKEHGCSAHPPFRCEVLEPFPEIGSAYFGERADRGTTETGDAE